MSFWWVNQKQTYRHEIGDGDGYLWSPKRQANGNSNFSYEFMKRVMPGDIVFSYANSALIAIGVAQTHCYSFPKPNEFGNAGEYWSDEGWKVDVQYTLLQTPIRTIDHIEKLRRVLPAKYSPIQAATGNANQAYLFKIDKAFALALAHLIDRVAVELVASQGQGMQSETEIDSLVAKQLTDWENRIEADLQQDEQLPKTQREALIQARIGQGRFRAGVLKCEHYCRITGVREREHLIASHIKPWRSSDNNEKLDPENGFMLTPTIDHLFDKGFISFENSGRVLLADVANRQSMRDLGVIDRTDDVRVPPLSTVKKEYLDWHRENIFL